MAHPINKNINLGYGLDSTTPYMYSFHDMVLIIQKIFGYRMWVYSIVAFLLNSES